MFTYIIQMVEVYSGMYIITFLRNSMVDGLPVTVCLYEAATDVR